MVGRRDVRTGLALALCACALAACGESGTSLLLELTGPSTVTRIDAAVVLGSGRSALAMKTLGPGGLPARLVIELPDVAQTVSIDLAGVTDHGTLHARTSVTARPHEQIRVPLAFVDESATDGGADGGPDGGPDGGDARLDGGGGTVPPTPRLITNAWFSNYSGATFSSGVGMAREKYEVPTTGIVDGDLVLFIGSIDNGSNTLWPNPVAPGFTQLAQQFYGNDGQTYVVAWKIANQEPATYSGTYGPGLNSGSSTISLIAVSGVNRAAPINASISTFDPGAGTSPVVGGVIGVRTTVPNCAILYASGADWLGQVGTNTFMPPSGYAPLAQIGDRGGSSWDWTSQQVAWTTQASAGDTGAIVGSMTGTFTGTAWTVVLAIAPAP